MALLRLSSGTLRNALLCCGCMGLHTDACRTLKSAWLLSRELSSAMRETSGPLECLAPGVEVRLSSVRIAEGALYVHCLCAARLGCEFIPRGHLYLM